MTEKETVKAQDNNIPGTNRIDALFEKIAILIERSRQFVANAVNVAEVKTRYEVGRYIYEDEQQGERASYGKQVLKKLSARLMSRYGEDWTYDTLKRCRFFIRHTLMRKLGQRHCPNWKIVVILLKTSKIQIGATPLPQFNCPVSSSLGHTI